MGDNLFWITSLLLVVLAVLFVAIPLLRHKTTVVAGQRDRDSANLAIFEERSRELQADLNAGVLDQQQYQELKTELELSLLSDVSTDGPDNETERAASAPESRSISSWLAPARLMPLIVVLMVAPVSYFLYDLWGFRDDLAVAELFERSRGAEDPREIMDLIRDLGEVARRDEENGWAWYFIARHLVTLGLMDDATQMFQRAAQYIEHPQDQAIVLGQYAQTAYIAAGQQMTQEVQDIISRAQRLDPNEQSILQLLAADAFVNEDYQSAVTYWQQLLTLRPSAEEAAFLRSVIAEAQQVLLAEGGELEPAAPALIEVSLSVSPDVEIPPGTRIFVSAQDLERPGPPLAAKLMTVEDLPAVITLNDQDAVGPLVLSSAKTVVLVATASLAGTADVQSGDYQARSELLHLDDADTPVRVQLLIQDLIP